jgi:hypothetical protein
MRNVVIRSCKAVFIGDEDWIDSKMWGLLSNIDMNVRKQDLISTLFIFGVVVVVGVVVLL